MTKIERDEIKRLAEKAMSRPSAFSNKKCDNGYSNKALFHAACSPEKIIALIEQIEKYEEALENIKNRKGDFPYAKYIRSICKEALKEFGE